MKIELESPVLGGLQLSSAQLLADIALGLYADSQVTLGQAADIAGMTQTDFMRFAGRCGVPMHYDVDDLHHDLAVLRERGAT